MPGFPPAARLLLLQQPGAIMSWQLPGEAEAGRGGTRDQPPREATRVRVYGVWSTGGARASFYCCLLQVQVQVQVLPWLYRQQYYYQHIATQAHTTTTTGGYTSTSCTVAHLFTHSHSTQYGTSYRDYRLYRYRLEVLLLLVLVGVLVH